MPRTDASVELDTLLDDIIARLMHRPTDSSVPRQERVTGIRFGAVGVGDESPPDPLEEKEVATETARHSSIPQRSLPSVGSPSNSDQSSRRRFRLPDS